MAGKTIVLASGTEIANWRSRTMSCVIYPDDNAAHAAALEIIRSSYSYLAICHNRDLCDDGSPKKLHYHIIVKFKQARWLSAVSSDLGVEANLWQDCKNFDGLARYFLHLDNEDKVQYEQDELEGDLRDLALKACVGKESEDERILRLLDLLDSVPHYLTLTQWVRMCCAAGLYADCRRAGYMMTRMLDEHNLMYSRGDDDTD